MLRRPVQLCVCSAGFSQNVPPLVVANGRRACLCINQEAVNLPFNRGGSRAGNYLWISNCADKEKEKHRGGRRPWTESAECWGQRRTSSVGHSGTDHQDSLWGGATNDYILMNLQIVFAINQLIDQSKKREMPQTPKWRLQIASFVQPARQNTKILYLWSEMTKKSSKISHLRSWKQ